MPAIVVGTVAYALLGLACISMGVRTRRGVGEYKVSRTVKVGYANLPRRERVRTGNALLVLGAVLLLCTPFSLFPVPVIAVLFLAALVSFIVYTLIQMGLRRAAQEIARTKIG